MTLPLRRTGLSRETPFFFSCKQCLLCCRHKKIQVNPYEVVRLASNLSLSTAAFIERYTHDSGTFLNWKADGTCVFLDSQGCTVHPDRPLVCRLYPLGRQVLPSGEENFSEIEPDGDCKGVYGEDGRIADYLESQGALPFMDSAEKYLDLLWRLYLVLEREAAEPEKELAIADVFRRFSGGERNGDMGLADVDAIVEAFCEKTGTSFPKDADKKMLIHIRAVEAWAHNSGRRRNHEAKKRRRVKTKGR
ncbi:MAG TPA: YkgJ family cysteine cluster protein [Syntrophales bacterium]|nr:YkgJ family cysteine cluster protein [Syntrophales bacterium]